MLVAVATRGVISTVGEGGPDERPEAAGSLQERAGPIAVLNVGRMGKDQPHPPVCVPQRMALAALHLLPGIIAAGTAALGGPDRLAVEDRGARACFAARPARDRP